MPIAPSFIKSLDISNLLLINAVRKPYGLAPSTSDLYNDKTETSLWCWELVCPQLHLAGSLPYKVSEHRLLQHHKSSIYKSLPKVIHAITSLKPSIETITSLHASYLKQMVKLQEALAKQKAKSLKYQLKCQEEDLKLKRAAEEHRQKELLRVQKETERQQQSEIREKQAEADRVKRDLHRTEKDKLKRDQEQARLQLIAQKEQERKDKESKLEQERKAKEASKEQDRLAKEQKLDWERKVKEERREADKLKT